MKNIKSGLRRKKNIFCRINFYLQFFIGAVAVFFLLAPGFSFAQSGDQEIKNIGVQVSPLRFDWNLFMGEEASGKIKVKNNNEEAYSVEVQIEDFEVNSDSESSNFFVPDENHPLKAYDVIDWISVSEMKFELAPGEVKDISFSTKVPDKTPTGGYYGAIFFKYIRKAENRNEQEEASRIMINTRLGILVTMAVKGAEPIIRNGILESFLAERKIFFEKPAIFKARTLNEGNIHFKAGGAVDIFRFGKKVDSIKIENKIIYPGKNRIFEGRWNFGWIDFGPYEARLNLTSEEGDVAFNKNINFWVIPWKTSVAVVFLMLFFYLLYKMGHYSGKRTKK